MHCAMFETYLVYWFSKDLCSIGGGSRVNLPWVYVHCAIYIYIYIYIYMKLIWCNGLPEICVSRSAKFGVVVFKASMLDWGGVDMPVDLPI